MGRNKKRADIRDLSEADSGPYVIRCGEGGKDEHQRGLRISETGEQPCHSHGQSGEVSRLHWAPEFCRRGPVKVSPEALRRPGGTTELVISASEMERKGQGILEEEDWDWVSALPFVRREIWDEAPAGTFPPL